MAAIEALNAGDITKVGVIAIIALLIIGILLSIVITALVGRLIVVVIVIVLGIFVWQQRTSVVNGFDKHKCDLNATFFGIHLDASDSVKQACRQHT